MEKEQEKEVTKSDLIWESIKDLRIDMYSLPNQRVADHVQRVKVSDDKVHLRLKSTSVVASLATALSKKYKMDENAGEYIVISTLAAEEKETEASKQSVVVKVTDNE